MHHQDFKMRRQKIKSPIAKCALACIWHFNMNGQDNTNPESLFRDVDQQRDNWGEFLFKTPLTSE
uniref:Uncharacterized protein n=1 Tax=Romanomermis culicivorax TaxID=13658 RepID=A0A915J379_ROMCU